ncbi:MAG TPA: hypothetical protein VG106_05220, partial [Vicinamibacterales bacterium]|nr:hypothetical protein [Vicinamibacterales bacterium]
MKILYVADDRAAAGHAARALTGLAPDLSFTWARTLGGALHWIDANRDAAALIVEAAVQAQSSASFVQQVRARSLTTAVVVVLRQPAESLDALSAGADGYVVAATVETDLRRVVVAAIERERARQTALAQKLAEIEAAQHQSQEERQEVDRIQEAQLAAASARLADVEARHKAALSREARISTALQERLLELEAALREADERRAAEAVASSDQLATLHAEFTSSLARAAQWRDTLA